MRKLHIKYLLLIIATVLISCQSKYDLVTFIESESYNILFSESEQKFFFDNITIKDLIDSVYNKCEDQEYTGDYTIIFPLNRKKELKYEIGIKGFVCPQSLMDFFYNPLNIYYLNDSLYIEKNLNSHNPIVNSAEFGEFIGIDSISRDNFKSVEKDSLGSIVRKHIDITFAEFTFEPLIQLIANDSIYLKELETFFEILIEEYYNLYTNLSKKIYNKHLEEIDKAEIERIKKIINDSGLKCNFRINSIQRIQQIEMTKP